MDLPLFYDSQADSSSTAFTTRIQNMVSVMLSNQLLFCYFASAILETVDTSVHLWIAMSLRSGDQFPAACCLLLSVIAFAVKWRVSGNPNPFPGLVQFLSIFTIDPHSTYHPSRFTNTFHPELSATHQIFESVPQCMALFCYVTYTESDNVLYAVSMVVSGLCVCCQLFNYLAATHNIHPLVLNTRWMCLVTDIVGTLAMLSSLWITVTLSNDSHESSSIGFLWWIFTMKLQFITLPFSFGMSCLFVLRSVGMAHNPHHRLSLYWELFNMLLVSMLIVISTVLSAAALEICVNLFWAQMVIDRLFNQRFSSFDENDKFWTKLVLWMVDGDGNRLESPLNTEESVLRLFAVNKCCAEIGRARDEALNEWMDGVYKKVFYTQSDPEYRITARDVSNHSQSTLRDLQSVFDLMVREQISKYFEGHNQSTTRDVIQYLTDTVERVNVLSYIVSRNDIEWCCRFLFESVTLNFVMWIGSPLYLCSRIMNVAFPLMVVAVLWWTESIGNITSFSLLSIGLYYLSLLHLAMEWVVHLCSASDFWSLVWALCPSLYRPNELYISRKYGEMTQKELFEGIKWYYRTHRHAELKEQLLLNEFGADITMEILAFLPKSYAEEKQIDSKLKQS